MKKLFLVLLLIAVPTTLAFGDFLYPLYEQTPNPTLTINNTSPKLDETVNILCQYNGDEVFQSSYLDVWYIDSAGTETHVVEIDYGDATLQGDFKFDKSGNYHISCIYYDVYQKWLEADYIETTIAPLTNPPYSYDLYDAIPDPILSVGDDVTCSYDGDYYTDNIEPSYLSVFFIDSDGRRTYSEIDSHKETMQGTFDFSQTGSYFISCIFIDGRYNWIQATYLEIKIIGTA